MHTLWKEPQADTDQSICSHLEQNAGQDHADFRWSIGVSVWQPGVEWEHGNFDGKGQEDQQECEQLQDRRDADLRYLHTAAEHVRGHRIVLHASCERHAGSRMRVGEIEVEQQDAHQHDRTAEERIQQEFPGRIDTSAHAMLHDLDPPDTDQEEHGSQFNFPEQEEEQQVERHEYAHHASFQDQHQGHIFLDTRFFPAANHCQHGQQGIQHDQGQTQPINTQEIADIELDITRLEGDPWQVYRVRQMVEVTKIITIEGDAEENRQRKHEGGCRKAEG